MRLTILRQERGAYSPAILPGRRSVINSGCFARAARCARVSRPRTLVDRTAVSRIERCASAAVVGRSWIAWRPLRGRSRGGVGRPAPSAESGQCPAYETPVRKIQIESSRNFQKALK
jgi:hypothetical protein